MDLLRKAACVGASAALLGSLVATVAAPMALASTSVISAGSIPVGRTSTGTATFVFIENSSAAFTGPGTLTVTVLDYAGGNTLTLGGGTVSGPGSLSPGLLVSGNTFTVTTLGADDVQIEVITISGIVISASSTAALGAIQATLSGSLADAVTVGGQYALASPGMVTSKASAEVERVARDFRVAQVITGLPPDWTGALVTLWNVYVSEGVTRDGTGPPLHHRSLSVRHYEMWCEGTAPRTCYSRDLLTASGAEWEFQMDAAARAAHLVGTVEVHEGSLVRDATIEASWTATDTFHGVGGAQRTDDPRGTSFYKTAYWDNNATVAMTFDGAVIDGQPGYLAVWKTMDFSVVP